MQLFLELRGIVQKSRAQFWLNLVSKGKRTHTCMDSEISLIAPDCHLRLHRNGKSPFGTKTWYTFKRDFMVAIASLNVWQRVSRGMMIYDNLAFLQLEGSIRVPFFGHIPTLSRGRIPIYGTDKHQYRGLLYTKDIAPWDQIWNWLRWVKAARFRWCTQKHG